MKSNRLTRWIKHILVATAARKSYTDLNCLDGRLVFDNGVGTFICAPRARTGVYFCLMPDDTDEKSPCLKGLSNKG